MPSLIGPAQEGFMRNKWIGHAAFDIITVQETLSKQRKAAALLFLDQQKAYDRVSHSYLKAVLAKFALPLTLRTAISAMYNQNTAQILGPQGPLPPILIQTGVRQGDPLSPLLFNLTIEPLAQHLQNKLQGISLLNSTFVFGFTLMTLHLD